MMTLTPCPACRRHVYATETNCPFCRHELGALVQPVRPPAVRMSRAALVVLGMSGVACGGTETQAVYGAPPVGAGGSQASATSGGTANASTTSANGGSSGGGNAAGAGGEGGEGNSAGVGGTTPVPPTGGDIPIYGAPPSPRK